MQPPVTTCQRRVAGSLRNETSKPERCGHPQLAFNVGDGEPRGGEPGRLDGTRMAAFGGVDAEDPQPLSHRHPQTEVDHGVDRVPVDTRRTRATA